ncbi:hypothetical protein KAR91_20180 [Candidatus Pacearchaeota archaeon]|nr:hypothetical protein [Candidatus Pacearchaeota archaeon]
MKNHPTLTPDQIATIATRAKKDPAWYIHNFVKVLDKSTKEWVQFRLWPDQTNYINKLHNHDRIVVLKARQVGLTSASLAYVLWYAQMEPNTLTLLLSIGDREAMDLINPRLISMYDKLPGYCKIPLKSNNDHEIEFNNNSRILSLPTNRGDSYTANIVIMDEIDLIMNQDKALRAVEPAVADGGKLVLLSRADKSRPNTPFKNVFRSAMEGENTYQPIFIPWWGRPDRSQEFYDNQVTDSLSKNGSLDYVHEQYPATPEEALAPRSLDKRLAAEWLLKCQGGRKAVEPDDMPTFPGITIYNPPIEDHKYVMGCDPAQGNPNSDDSTIVVMDVETGEEVANVRGKIEPSTIAEYLVTIGGYYNDAAAMIEANNHGLGVIDAVKDHRHIRILRGSSNPPSQHYGWWSNRRTKTILYDIVAECCRDQHVLINDSETYLQLAHLDGNTLLAPSGEHDDLADAFALACAGREQLGSSGKRQAPKVVKTPQKSAFTEATMTGIDEEEPKSTQRRNRKSSKPWANRGRKSRNRNPNLFGKR